MRCSKGRKGESEHLCTQRGDASPVSSRADLSGPRQQRLLRLNQMGGVNQRFSYVQSLSKSKKNAHAIFRTAGRRIERLMVPLSRADAR